MFDKDEEARKLAEIHYELETGLTQIYRIKKDPKTESMPGEPIKLLEVNENTIPIGIQPLGFPPVPERGIHFPSIIIEVTPKEFDRIKSNELPLYEAWNWTEEDLVPRPVHGTTG